MGVLTFDSGNRFGQIEEGLKFEGVTELHLNETLLAWDEVCQGSCKCFIPLLICDSYRLWRINFHHLRRCQRL